MTALISASTSPPPDGFTGFLYSPSDLAGLGYRLAASSGTAFAAMVKAVRQSYECLALGKMDPFLGSGGADKEMKAAQTTSAADVAPATPTGIDHIASASRMTFSAAVMGVIHRAKPSQISAYVPAAIEFHCSHSIVRMLDSCGVVAVFT